MQARTKIFQRTKNVKKIRSRLSNCPQNLRRNFRKEISQTALMSFIGLDNKNMHPIGMRGILIGMVAFIFRRGQGVSRLFLRALRFRLTIFRFRIFLC